MADEKKALVDALQECLKYERTLADCFGGYQALFCRWRIHRLAHWMAWQHKAAAGRVMCLQVAICGLDALPADGRYDFDLEELERADDIGDIFGYFRESLAETRDAYARARPAAKDADDATAAHLISGQQRDVEDCLGRIEAKQHKVQLIGPELYLAEHMHHLVEE